MKRLLLLAFLLGSISSSYSQCPSPEVAPWADDVESMTATTVNINQNCWVSTGTGYDWNIDGAGSTPTAGTGPLGANSGVNYFYVEASSGTAGVSTCTLTSPQIDVTGLTLPTFEFYYHMFGPQIGTLTVEAWDGATWNQVDQIVGQQQTLQADPWVLRTIYLTGYTGVIQLRFVALSAGTLAGDISIDDFSVFEAPTCLTPSALSASNILANSADLTWLDNSGAGLSNIEYGPAGFTPGSGTLITGTTNNPENITGLSPITNYEFYVQSDCGGGDLSPWAGPFSFQTPCAAFIAPWTDDVESMTATTGIINENCWSASSPNAYDWNITGIGTTPSTGTGPNSANSGVKYFYIEASTTLTGPAVLNSPDIDVSALTLPMLEFYYHMFGNVTGDLAVEVWDGATWNVVDNIVGQQQTVQTDPWVRREVILTGYTGIIQIRFVATGSGSTQYGDISIDDISVLEAPTCPAPSNFSLTGSDLSSADLIWTSTGSETEWQLEYGAPGFTPDVQLGTSILTSNNPETITGLTANSFYEVYLQAVCSPGDTSTLVGPIVFNTYNQGLYMDWNSDCGPGFTDISGTGVNTNLLDDQELGLALPFSLLYQGTLVNDITIGENGGILLGTQTGILGFGNGTVATAADGIYAFWDDLEMLWGGIYYETIGTAPNQVFIVQYQEQNRWNAPAAPNGETITYQIQIHEATGEIYVIYPDSEFGGSDAFADNGSGATIGVSGPNQDINVSYNSSTYLENNSCIHYYYTDCPAPVNYTVVYTTNDEAGISWAAGLAGETDWTVIYGPAGFDPLVSGTTINTTSPVAIIPGLNDITTYDVYIYADCNPGTLQSTGFVGQFTTLPNCSDVTGITTATAVDSLFSGWSWTESSGVGTYASTGFNLQYGMTGFGLYDGTETIVNADNNYTDTTEDMTLLGGGVYQLYVQAVCGTDTSNWVGPVTFTMPLSNDSTCNAIDLMVDGSVYVFNNAGATTQLNESTVAPPATGYNTTDGWGNSNINFTTWFTFTAPASGNMYVSGTDVGFDGQIAIYETTDCSNFNTYTLIAANDDALYSGSAAPEFTVCGLTPGATYYLMHDSWSTVTTGNYSISLEEIVVEAGTSSGVIDVCTGDTVNLFDGISGYDMGGTWTEAIPTANFADPLFPSAGLAYQLFNFEYEVVNGCARDTIEQQVLISGPSSAGIDGTMTVCQNEPVNLLAGLSGNIDLGGTWYDPTNTALPSGAITASNIPGLFNYDYITGNGVCPDDTANVVVTVSPTCDYLNLQEVYFGTMEVYPNPTSGMIYIANAGSVEVFNFEITDVNGKVIAAKDAAINGTETTEINLSDIEPGIYMINVFNDNAKTTYRIVKQ